MKRKSGSRSWQSFEHDEKLSGRRVNKPNDWPRRKRKKELSTPNERLEKNGKLLWRPSAKKLERVKKKSCGDDKSWRKRWRGCKRRRRSEPT